jgi:hypothetical protein
MKLIVAVETVKIGEGIVAGAVVYPVNVPAPIFTYTDKQGRRRTVGLEDFSRLSDVYQQNILRYLKQSTLSWAVVPRRDPDRQTAAALSVARALERLKHFRPEAVARREDLVVHVPKTLPPERLGNLTQVTWSEKRTAPWGVLAASALAKTPAVCIFDS